MSQTGHIVDRQEVAQVLERIAAFQELRGENAYRVRAFRTAARAVSSLPRPIQDALADGTLAETRGVGPATVQIIQEIVGTGHSSLLEDLREQVPPGLVEMLAIGGLGVTKIRQIHESLGVDTLPELEAAARDGRLAQLPRFGKRTAENVIRGIASLRQATEFRLHHHAREEAVRLVVALERLPGVLHAHIAGDVRRAMELVRDVVVVVEADCAPQEIFQRLADLPGVHEFAGQDERVVMLRFVGGASARVVVTTRVNAGAVLVQATGSAEHLRRLGEHAATSGHTLRAAALWRGNSFTATPDEGALYGALGLPWIPPELREGMGEVEAAAAGALPALVGPEDIRGVLHCHTVDSDGTNTVVELADAVAAAGFAYLGITDHSESAAYAGGLDPAIIAQQAAEIDGYNRRQSGFRALKGIEADILADGSLDYDAETLASLDFVIASVHSRFHMTEEEMTARVLKTMDNPYVAIIGHPTGRLLLARKAFPLDMDAIMEKAAAVGVALEINADPHRLDLDWRLLRRAKERGVKISIGADAHSIAGIANMEIGVGLARKGWLGPADILNTLPVDEFVRFACHRRPR